MTWRRISAMISAEGDRAKDAKSQSKHPAHMLTASAMNRELLQLLALFLAGRQIVDSPEKDMTVRSSREDPLVTLVNYNWEPTVTSLLIETAVKNRWLLDAWWEQRDQPWRRKDRGLWDIRVGEFSKGGGVWKPLSLRESCNKIIHAKRIYPELDGKPPAPTGKVETTGEEKRVRWRAKIDIRNYVRASLFNTYGGIDFPRGWMHT